MSGFSPGSEGVQSRKCRRPWRKAWLGLGRPGGHVLGRHLRPRLRMESGFSVERCRFFGRRWVVPDHTATPRPALESGLRGRFLQGAVLPKSSPGHVSSAPERPGLRSCYSGVVRGTGLRGAAGRPATDREMEGTGKHGSRAPASGPVYRANRNVHNSPHPGRRFCPPPGGTGQWPETSRVV